MNRIGQHRSIPYLVIAISTTGGSACLLSIASLERLLGTVIFQVLFWSIALVCGSFIALVIAAANRRGLIGDTLVRRLAATLAPLTLLFAVVLPIGDRTPEICISLTLTAVAAVINQAYRRLFQERLALASLLSKPGRASAAIVLVCIILSIGYWVPYIDKSDFSDKCAFAYDDWQYHMLGVNLAKGHGFPKVGLMERFDEYRYKWIRGVSKQSRKRELTDAGKKGGVFSFYRAPVYPMYVGALYFLTDISPKRLKQSQLMMLVMIAGFLPFAGWLILKSTGFIAGFPAGFLFLEHTASTVPNRILTEPLMMVWIFFFVLWWALWKHRTSVATTVVFGVITAACFLTKGAFFFLPLIVLIYELILYKKGKLPGKIPAAFALTVGLAIGCWSAYATSNAECFVLMSTQADRVLLEVNNEFCLETGGWCRAGSKKGFYVREDIKDLPLPVKLVRFAWAYRGKMPGLLYKKLGAGFGSYTHFLMGLLLLLLLWLRRDCEPPDARTAYVKNGILISGYNVALSISAVLGLIYFHSDNLESNILGFPANPLIMLLAIIGVGVWSHLRRRKVTPKIPAAVLLLLSNFILIVLVVFGLPRYILPIYFLILLMYFYLAIETARWIGDSLEKLMAPSSADCRAE
jgi:hypothetical protein